MKAILAKDVISELIERRAKYMAALQRYESATRTHADTLVFSHNRNRYSQLLNVASRDLAMEPDDISLCLYYHERGELNNAIHTHRQRLALLERVRDVANDRIQARA